MFFMCRGINLVCKRRKQPAASMTALLEHEQKKAYVTKPFLDFSQ